MLRDFVMFFKPAKLPYEVLHIPPDEDDKNTDSDLRFFSRNGEETDLIRAPLINSGFQLEAENPRICQIVLGTRFTDKFLNLLNDFQKVNHFSSLIEIGSKDGLHLRMKELQKRLGHPIPFYPLAFFPPSDYEELLQIWPTKPVWIIKAPALSRARYIRLAYSKDEPAPMLPWVIEEYISPPYLITGRKFDIRIYVLVTSIDPLIFYFYDEGLALFATHLYDENGDITDLQMHLTNYEINKGSENFVECNSPDEKVEDSKWSLTFLWKYLETNGINTKKLKAEIEDLITCTIIAGMCTVRNRHRERIKHKRKSSFELLGVDILLDANLKPYLLEVNVSPGLSGTSDLDVRIKSKLMVDTYNIVRILDLSAYDTAKSFGYIESEKIYYSSKTNQRVNEVVNENLDPWISPVFADYTIIREFIDEQDRRRGWKRAYPRKKNIEKYRQCFDQYTYEDIVLNKWLLRSKQDRFSVLTINFDMYWVKLQRCVKIAKGEIDPEKGKKKSNKNNGMCGIQ